MKKLNQEHVSSLGEFIGQIRNIQSENPNGSHVYRGQADESWHLVSGVYRRIESGKKESKMPSTVSNKEVIEYLSEKLDLAMRRLTPAQIAELRELNDLNLLVEMQHYGSATNLLDFTFNSLTALYFAVADEPKAHGKVFCIDINDLNVTSTNEKNLESFKSIPEETIHSYLPYHINKKNNKTGQHIFI